jgi:hypothetical protein
MARCSRALQQVWFRGRRIQRQASRYSSRPSRNWVKTKCFDWKRINAERWRIFEGPCKPELTEAQKTLGMKRHSQGSSSACDRRR